MSTHLAVLKFGVLGFNVKITETDGDLRTAILACTPSINQAHLDALIAQLDLIVALKGIDLRTLAKAIAPVAAHAVVDVAITLIEDAINGAPLNIITAVKGLAPTIDDEALTALEQALTRAPSPAATLVAGVTADAAAAVQSTTTA
jgi:hypothetical protein